MPRGGGKGGRGKGGPPPKRGAFHSGSGAVGGGPRVQIPDGLPVDLGRYKDVEFVEIDGSVLEGVSAHNMTMLPVHTQAWANTSYQLHC